MADADVTTRKPGYRLAGFPSVLPQVFKYQIVTKLLMGVLILPVFGLASGLLVANQGAVTNANMLGFLLSWRGIVFLVALIGLFLVGIVLELAGFITISSRASHGQPEASYGSLVRFSASRIRNLLGLGGVVLLLYLVIVMPLTGIGANLSFLDAVRIPNFITSVIWGNPLYATGYSIVLVLLGLLSIALIYTFHVIVICDYKAWPAMRASARLIRHNLGIFLRGFVWKSVLVVLVMLGIVLAWIIGIALLLGLVGAESAWMRVLMIVLLLVQQVGVLLAAMVFVPFEVYLLTRTFEASIARDPELSSFVGSYPEVPAKQKASALDRILGRRKTLIALTTVAVLALAIPGGLLFNDVFRADRDILVIAHRAGGNSAPENSIQGLDNTVSLGVKAVEIDVQRTSDGAYVLNHDDTFARLAGVNKKVNELTLAEVKALDISAAKDGSVRVPTLEEFLIAAKGRATSFIELKGATADTQMVDDVVALIDRLGMRDQVVLISLKYDLITYIEDRYPAYDSGFLYFLSIGDATKLVGDYIIMEEAEGTDERLAALMAAGKRPIVWTVNTPESMEKFADKEVYGLITDEMADLQKVIEANKKASSAELLARLFGQEG